MFGVFRVKNHDFTPKNLIFPNCEGRRENVWSIMCEKSRFYAKKKIIFYPILGGGARRVRPPPGSALVGGHRHNIIDQFLMGSVLLIVLVFLCCPIMCIYVLCPVL
jgi:hypothetical protein